MKYASIIPLQYIDQVEIENVRWLWHSDYFDGRLSGLAVFKDKHYWIQCGEENEFTSFGQWYRRFYIIDITVKQLQCIQNQHNDFEKYVGLHCNYNEDNEREVGKTRDQSEWHKYYDKYKNQPNDWFHENEIIGWYMENF